MKLSKFEILLVSLAVLSAMFTVAAAAINEDPAPIEGPSAYHGWYPGPVAYPPPYLIAPEHFPWDRMPTLPPQAHIQQVPPPFYPDQNLKPEKGTNSGQGFSQESHLGQGGKP